MAERVFREILVPVEKLKHGFLLIPKARREGFRCDPRSLWGAPVGKEIRENGSLGTWVVPLRESQGGGARGMHATKGTSLTIRTASPPHTPAISPWGAATGSAVALLPVSSSVLIAVMMSL